MSNDLAHRIEAARKRKGWGKGETIERAGYKGSSMYTRILKQEGVSWDAIRAVCAVLDVAIPKIAGDPPSDDDLPGTLAVLAQTLDDHNAADSLRSLIAAARSYIAAAEALGNSSKKQ